jgi:tetratricopeptide (TPR) repeat protein
VVDLRPGDLAEFYLGLVAIRQGRFDDAVHSLRTAVQRAPDHGAVHLNLAYALERMGRLDEARAAHARAAHLLPDDAAVQLTGAVLAIRRGDIHGADAALRASAARSNGKLRSAAWFHYAGLCAAYLGDLERAAAILSEGLKLHRHAAALANNLAAIEERRGRLSEAATVVERGLQEQPGLAQLHKNAGDLHYRSGRYDEALECYARAVGAAPDLGGDVWLKLGNIRYRRQEPDDAVRCWERAVALAPGHPAARSNLDMVRRSA